MTNAQWAELLAALRELRPSAWSAWIPFIAGLAGTAFGFLISTLKDQLTRATQRRQSAAEELYERRRIVVEAFNVDVSKWILSWSGLRANRNEHHQHNMTVASGFVTTGDARDGVLQPSAYKFLNGLEDSLNSFSMGWPEDVWPNRWTDQTESVYLQFANELRTRTEQWLRGAESTEALNAFLLSQVPKLDALRVASLRERDIAGALG